MIVDRVGLMQTFLRPIERGRVGGDVVIKDAVLRRDRLLQYLVDPFPLPERIGRHAPRPLRRRRRGHHPLGNQ
jgi:hypothetical protein